MYISWISWAYGQFKSITKTELLSLSFISCLRRGKKNYNMESYYWLIFTENKLHMFLNTDEYMTL